MRTATIVKGVGIVGGLWLLSRVARRVATFAENVSTQPGTVSDYYGQGPRLRRFGGDAFKRIPVENMTPAQRKIAHAHAIKKRRLGEPRTGRTPEQQRRIDRAHAMKRGSRGTIIRPIAGLGTYENEYGIAADPSGIPLLFGDDGAAYRQRGGMAWRDDSFDDAPDVLEGLGFSFRKKFKKITKALKPKTLVSSVVKTVSDPKRLLKATVMPAVAVSEFAQKAARKTSVKVIGRKKTSQLSKGAVRYAAPALAIAAVAAAPFTAGASLPLALAAQGARVVSARRDAKAMRVATAQARRAEQQQAGAEPMVNYEYEDEYGQPFNPESEDFDGETYDAPAESSEDNFSAWFDEGDDAATQETDEQELPVESDAQPDGEAYENASDGEVYAESGGGEEEAWW